MRDFSANASTEIGVDLTVNNTEEILDHRLSLDGHYLGLLYCRYDDIIPSKGKVAVKLIDMRSSKNHTRHWELYESAIDDIRSLRASSTFNANLSILRVGNRLYDLNSAMDETTAAPFSSSDSVTEGKSVLFSSCNQFLCCIDGREFKIYELCRITKVLLNLRVSGAQFSSKIFCCAGEFHPHLPILVLIGWPQPEEMLDTATGRLQAREVIEVDLSSLTALELPPPRFSWFPDTCHRFHPGSIQFSNCGRFVWAYARWYEDQEWVQIAKTYTLTDERLIGKLPFVWGELMIYNQKLYAVTTKNDFVILQLRNQEGHSFGETPQPSVQLTSIPSSMRMGRNYSYYLLPGREEQSLARVLLVSRSEKAAMIKVLPVTMKEILTKLHEIAETRRIQEQISETSLKSQSTDEEAENFE